MKKEELKSKAETYLSLEENTIFRKEVEELLQKEQWEELSDLFWRELDFGTGGLRGVIGGGDNRINTFMIRKATQGLARYIISHVAESERGAVVAYDSRRFSSLFAQEVARVMAANGIKTWLFTSLRPTPVLSYAVRHLGASTGVMITASHNPAKYNGYKVFWSDGAQVVPPHDKGIIAEVRKVAGPIDAMDKEEALRKGLIIPIDSLVDDAYHEMVAGQALNQELLQKQGKNLKVVYSPLHGTGRIPVETVLNRLGISVLTVPQQRDPDGDFPTVEFPNPETAPALKMALDLGRREQADLVMATDPDADRLGIAVPNGEEWNLITGNQLGALLADYVFCVLKEQGRLPAKPAFVNTIVTSEFQNRIAESHGATSFRVLTGFKYIGEKIKQFEAENSFTYVFGGEESYGYLIGTAVRDKDAVSAAAMTAEMALWNQSRGMTVMDHLRELWARFGYWEERLISRDFHGQQGQQIMMNLMASLRDEPPTSIASIPVVSIRDYREGTTRSMKDGSIQKNIQLPSSNVLQFNLEDGSLITARPSGTEPKIKFYASCCSSLGKQPDEGKTSLAKVFAGVDSWVNQRISQVSD